MAVVALLFALAVACAAAPQRAKIPPPDFPEWEGWAPINGRAKDGIRLAYSSLPDTPPLKQASYYWDNFVEQVHHTSKNIAYGSVLNSHRAYTGAQPRVRVLQALSI